MEEGEEPERGGQWQGKLQWVTGQLCPWCTQRCNHPPPWHCRHHTVQLPLACRYHRMRQASLLAEETMKQKVMGEGRALEMVLELQEDPGARAEGSSAPPRGFPLHSPLGLQGSPWQ